MRVVLSEKPSVARDIARHLGAHQRKEGYLEGQGWAVTWAFGHLVELKEPEEYRPELRKWSLEHLPFVPERFELRPRGDKDAQAQLNIVKGLLTQATEIVCATDAGREGELIFRYIASWAGLGERPFRRLWISSLTNEAIALGFKNLRDGRHFDALYQAARCRSEADWIVGLNATRFFTVKYGGGYGSRDALWSLGRVQTPVLAMIVARDLEIEAFREEPYWELHTVYRKATFKHEHGRFDQEAAARSRLERVQGAPLEITEVEEKTESIPAPLLYDLTELQKDMNRRHGLTADATLKAAQSLYERKHLTYPRTDSRYLTQDLTAEIPALLQKLRARRPAEIARLDLGRLDFGPRLVNDLKVTDHHAIIPTNVLPAGLEPDENKIYEAVLTRFIAAFYPPCVKAVTTARAQSAGERFRAVGSVVITAGWRELEAPPEAGAGGKKSPRKKTDPEPGDEALGEDAEIPRFERGEKGPHKPEVKTFKTKPPRNYTEAALLNMMETAGRLVEDESLRHALKERGLGTPATRAAIIETLLRRGYVERRKKNLLSTAAGRRLISLVQDKRLKSPELTGEWEATLKRIEEGQHDPEAFMSQVVEHTRALLRQPEPGAELLPPCPLCGEALIEGQKGYGCSKWKTGCRFVLWKTQFGASLTAPLAAEILREGRSATPLLLTVEGQSFFGRIEHRAGVISFSKTEAPSTSPSAANGKKLGTCPVCGGAVTESPKAFGCANWKSGCKFTVWKSLAGVEISKDTALALMQRGRTEVIRGFKSKAGKAFEARLVVEGNAVRFQF